VPITVLKNNVPWGPFSRAQIRDGLARGDFTLQYLAHAPGLREWLPLGEVLDYFDRGSTLPPVPTSLEPPDRIAPAGLTAPTDSITPGAVLPTLPVRPPILPPQPARVAEPVVRPVEKATIPTPATMPEIELEPAPFFPRFIAFAIDCAVLFLPLVLLFGISALTIQIEGWAEHNDAETMRQDWVRVTRDFHALLWLVALGGGWLYAALLECSHWQATVGKRWMGIKVTDGRGQRLTFFRATGRHAAKFVSALPCFLGFTAALFNPRRLALHDLMATTRVVRR
jgi:uncharacterized RDD family membrane protein YckC